MTCPIQIQPRCIEKLENGDEYNICANCGFSPSDTAEPAFYHFEIDYISRQIIKHGLILIDKESNLPFRGAWVAEYESLYDSAHLIRFVFIAEETLREFQELPSSLFVLLSSSEYQKGSSFVLCVRISEFYETDEDDDASDNDEEKSNVQKEKQTNKKERLVYHYDKLVTQADVYSEIESANKMISKKTKNSIEFDVQYK